uniref:Uncharacterized protein n=1 Tax=Romanomermis culicivorax TaxID=13658 RepID=A0A915JWR2_ROMCU
MKLLIVIITLGFSTTADGCGSKQPVTDAPASDNDAVKNALGDKVNISPYDESGYKGTASSADDLKCDFSSSCCWKNAVPPVDQLQWNKGSGQVDADKFNKAFSTSTLPNGDFLLIAVNDPAGGSDKGVLYSCTIPCGQDVTLKATTWATSGVNIKACTSTSGDGSSETNCQPLSGSNGQPATATFSGQQSNTNLVILADGFTNPSSMAIVDDISAQYTPCGSSSAAATTAAPDSGAGCKEVTCDFNNDLCTYTPGAASTSQWETAGPQTYKNPATGVRPSPDKSKFAGCYLKPGGKCSLEKTTSLFAGGPKTVRWQEYKATEGINFKACCDKIEGCNYESGTKVVKQDFGQWYQGGISCPQGTQKIIYYAENTGQNEGGVGLDNVKVFNSETDNTPLC